MLFKTKLLCNVNQIFYALKKRVLIVQNSFSLALFSLFLGFLCGNLFGTFLDTLRIYFLWNGFIAFIILLFIEAINFFVYRIPLSEKKEINLSVSNTQNSSFLLSINTLCSFFRYKIKLRKPSNEYPIGVQLVKVQYKARDVCFAEVSETLFTIYIEKSLNAFKIGLLFGFFIDSFKVGS